MYFNISRVMIIVTVPKENTEEVRMAICNEGAGVIGNYSHCSVSTKCIGTFKPNNDANPYIGENNKLEINCEVDKVKGVVSKIREVHPYEEPLINIIPLLDENNF